MAGHKQNTPGMEHKLSDVERAAQSLLQQNDNGDIDNVWDIIDELMDIEQRLPATSPLRAEWNVFYEECESIMRGDD